MECKRDGDGNVAVEVRYRRDDVTRIGLELANAVVVLEEWAKQGESITQTVRRLQSELAVVMERDGGSAAPIAQPVEAG